VRGVTGDERAIRVRRDVNGRKGRDMRPRILVVEDNEVLRRPLQRALQTSGYEVLAVGTGEEALTSLAATDVHLVVTDRGLPGMDGGELIRRIRIERPALPIVMMTGHADSGLPDEIARLRVEGALLKPFEPDALLAVIEQALAQGMATRPTAEGGRVGVAASGGTVGRSATLADPNVVAMLKEKYETHSTIGEANAG